MTDGSKRQAEVVPARIQRLDQGDFLGSAPLFDFFFTGNCGADAGMWLEPNELGDVVFLCEARDFLLLMLPYSAQQIICHAGIQDP